MANSVVPRIVSEALERHDPAERMKYLDQACAGDAQLRRSVEELLAAHPGTIQFVEASASSGLKSANGTSPDLRTVSYLPAWPDDTAQFADSHSTGTPADTDTPGAGRPNIAALGTTIGGRYTLIDVMGEGGMGIVYLAEQTEPVKRSVALKVIKTGMDSKAVLARFDAERQALALMDHPNIARVYDGGTTESGQPFFVMELARGVTLTKYCDSHRLSVEARLQLFIPVCQAVQHAHQKGIIHRDLKPGNVLVLEVDGRPTPKVIDFGLAKATEQQLNDLSISETGAIVGTPAYMSPEQADPGSLDIDTRTDVYALGIILYELLVGSTPIDSKQFRQGGILAMMRMVKELELPRPSTKLSSSESLPRIAENRGIEPAKLEKLLQGELDWVVMKAIEKDRTRRYDTALALARDVQRYLADEMVEARPPSRGYRLGKILRRNKGLVIAASLVFVVLIMGITGTTAAMIKANKESENALHAAEKEGRARQAESERADGERAARQLALSEKRRAEQAEDDTLADYRANTDDAIEQLIASKQAIGPREKLYLEKTLKRWQSFASRVGDDERSRYISATGHHSVGSLLQRLGQKTQAREEYERALSLYQTLANEFPNKAGYGRNVHGLHNNLAMLLFELGEHQPARQHYQQAIKVGRALVDQFSNDPSYRRYLAYSHNNLAQLHATLGETDQAYQQYVEARELLLELSRDPAHQNDFAHELSVTYNNLAMLLVAMGRRPEARTCFEKARDLTAEQLRASPGVIDFQLELADIHNNLGGLFFDLGKWPEALVEFEDSLKLKLQLAQQFPANPLYQQRLGSTQTNMGMLLTQMGKPDEAAKHHELAIRVSGKLAEEYPGVPTYTMQFATSLSNFGMLLRNRGEVDKSIDLFSQAITKLGALYQKEPRNVTTKLFLGKFYYNRAIAWNLLSKHEQALKDWNKAVEMSNPENETLFKSGRAACRVRTGVVAEAVVEVAELLKKSSWSAEQWYDFACVYAIASDKDATMKDTYAIRAMELLKKAIQAGYKDAAHLASDSDLIPLRQREDFRQMLEDLQKRQATRK